MEKKILSIKVQLIKGEPDNQININILNEVTGENETINFQDDSDTSFTTLTTSLTKCLTSFQRILPHKSNSFLKTNKTKEELLFDEVVEEPREKEKLAIKKPVTSFSKSP